MIQRLDDAVRRRIRHWLLIDQPGGPTVPPAAPAPTPDGPSLDYIHDQLVDQLKQQATVWEDLDSRLRLVLGLTGVLFAAVLGFQRSAVQLSFLVGVLIIGSVVLFFGAAVIAALAFRTREFDWPPRPQGLLERYLQTDPKVTKLAVSRAIVYAYNRNALVIRDKNRSFNRAFVVAAVALFLLGAALVIHIAFQTLPPGVDGPVATPTATPVATLPGGLSGSGANP